MENFDIRERQIIVEATVKRIISIPVELYDDYTDEVIEDRINNGLFDDVFRGEFDLNDATLCWGES